MDQPALRPGEIVGLAVALLAHALLVLVLWLQPLLQRDPMPIPERITVSLAEDVAPESSAPNPAEDSQAAMAPVFGEVEPAAASTAQGTEIPPPQPRPTARIDPAPRASPSPRPSQRVVQRPAQNRPTPQPSSSADRIGSDFLEGSNSGQATSNAVPAAAIGPAERASLAQAISRQLKRHWSAPQGVDTEKLVTVLAWDLNKDGSLKGYPRLVSQTGVNDANRAQASRHVEQAIRAVQLAAPFDLPPEYYNGWKRITAWRFDRNLSR